VLIKDERQALKRLRKENKEWRLGKYILNKPSAFFAKEIIAIK
jgi:transposase